QHVVAALPHVLEAAFDETRLAVGQEGPGRGVQAHRDADRELDDLLAALGQGQHGRDGVQRLRLVPDVHHRTASSWAMSTRLSRVRMPDRKSFRSCEVPAMQRRTARARSSLMLMT